MNPTETPRLKGVNSQAKWADNAEMPDMKKSGYIIVPCFNEEARLPADTFVKFANSHENTVFLFVNDGSTDGTLALLQRTAAQSPDSIHVLNLERNQGKAEAVRQGYNHILKSFEPAFIAYWDADLATPLNQIPIFLRHFEGKDRLDILMGSRVQLLGADIQRSPLRHYLGRIFATCASSVLGLPVYDTQCGAKMFRVNETTSAVFKEPFGSRWIFDVELLARYLKDKKIERGKAGCHIHELAIPEWHDVSGSKVNPLDFFRAFFELFSIALKYR